jgi:hypothetical protein
MASGILAKLSPSLGTDTVLYTVPAGKTTSCTVSLLNRSTSDGLKVRLALTLSGVSSPSASDYIEYENPIPPVGVLERSAIVLGSGQSIIVRTSASDLSAVVFGIEE